MKKIIILSFLVMILFVIVLFTYNYKQNESSITTTTIPEIISTIQKETHTQNTYLIPILEQSSTLSPSIQLINLPENKHIQDYIQSHGGLSVMTNEQKNEVRTMLNIYKASIRK